MAPDGRTDELKDGHGQTYIPPPLAGDNNVVSADLCHFISISCIRRMVYKIILI